MNYFLLRGEPVPRPPPPAGTADDVADIRVWTTGERRAGDVVRLPNGVAQIKSNSPYTPGGVLNVKAGEPWSYDLPGVGTMEVNKPGELAGEVN